jgi:hypothetical protein
MTRSIRWTRNVDGMAWKLESGDELVTIDEAAQRLGWSARTLAKWRSEFPDGAPQPVNAEPGARKGRHLYLLSSWERYATGAEAGE